MSSDLGLDLACVSDLDPAMRPVSGRRCLAEAIVRRLTTPRGRLIDDANYGFDLSGFLGDDVTPATVAQLASQVQAECLKDERVIAAQATLTFGSGALIATILIQDAAGPFNLVAAISTITATLLSSNL